MSVYIFYGDPFGPLAMILCELGQVRKEATAADDSCAEVWLLGLPPNLNNFKSLLFNFLPAYFTERLLKLLLLINIIMVSCTSYDYRWLEQ